VSSPAHPLLLFLPYPSIDADGGLADGLQMSQADYCRTKCGNHICATYPVAQADAKVLYSTCPNGFSVATVRIGNVEIRINGVIEAFSNKASAAFKKSHRDARKLKSEALGAWVKNVAAATNQYDAAVREGAANAVAALHDVKSLIGGILHTAEEWIQVQAGSTLDEQVENSSENLRTIYHSCRLLSLLLRMTDLVANPESATFGKRGARSIYGLFFACVRIMQARAAKRGIELRMTGKSFLHARVYESIGVVPLVLIDNAVKYARPNSVVTVKCSDMLDESILVEVVSEGEVVAPEERSEIFQRGFRGSNAKRAATGSGLGLFVAQHVAIANESRIRYEARDGLGFSGVGVNTFSMLLKGVRVY